jgi:hypothetical protein
MPIDHRYRAREAWPILVQRAQTGDRPFTYRALSDRLGYHYRAADYFLAVIQGHCLAHGLPNLAALAVNATGGLPGRGYAGARDREGFERELATVCRHDWPPAAPF